MIRENNGHFWSISGIYSSASNTLVDEKHSGIIKEAHAIGLKCHKFYIMHVADIAGQGKYYVLNYLNKTSMTTSPYRNHVAWS